ncbi:MAG: 16S rRNA (adenine(1518)-N(6)/adenine(1519)-N(6))-dimethyltransferase RsmA [Polyangiaceae bacterium]
MHGIAPKKRFGQNFLTDPSAARKIAEAATTPEGGTVLEIGPGTGALTVPLIERAAQLVAIERDADLLPVLHDKLAGEVEGGRVALIEGDDLLDWPSLLEGRLRPHAVAGNVPYSHRALIEMAIAAADALDVVVMMVQKEVADRLLAQPGSKEYGALTVFTRAAFDIERVLVVRRGSFFPRPEVDSAVVKLTPVRPRRALETEDFRAVVKAAFGMRRKTLRNAWRGIFGWSNEELAARRRRRHLARRARRDPRRRTVPRPPRAPEHAGAVGPEHGPHRARRRFDAGGPKSPCIERKAPIRPARTAPFHAGRTAEKMRALPAFSACGSGGVRAAGRLTLVSDGR